MRRPLLLGLVVGTLVLLAAPVASAQEATPAAESDRAAFVVPSSECVINALMPGDLNALATPAPAGAAASPVAAVSEVPFGAPDGEAADAETAAAVTGIIRQAFACINGGAWGRYFALFTADEVRRNFTPEEVATLFGTPTTEMPAEEQAAVFAILDIEILEDGRAGAFVVADTANNPAPVEIVYLTAVETEAGWRIDGTSCFTAGTGEPC